MFEGGGVTVADGECEQDMFANSAGLPDDIGNWEVGINCTSDSFYQHTEHHYHGNLHNLEDVPVNAALSTISMAMETPQAGSWSTQESRLAQPGLYDLECSPISPPQCGNDFSRFGYPADPFSDESFTSSQGTDTSDNFIGATASNAWLAYCCAEAVIGPMPSPLARLNADPMLHAPCHSEFQMKKPISPHMATLPQRKPKQARQKCTVCESTFSRPSDLVRHQRDIHERGNIIYRCNVCKHTRFGRQDKVREHFRRRHLGATPVIEIINDAETAAALHFSVRRQKARQRGQDE